MMGITIILGVMLTGCIDEIPGGEETRTCTLNELLNEETNECEVVDDAEEKAQVIIDAQLVADSARLYCTEIDCSPETIITYKELKRLLVTLSVDYYMFDLYNEGDELRTIAIYNEDEEFEVILYARNDGDYEWQGLAPEYIDESLQLDELRESNGTSLNTGGSIFDNTKRDKVAADALALRQAVQYYCLDSNCTVEKVFTYSDLEPYVAGIDREYYQFHELEDALIVAIYYSNDVIPVTLLAADDEDYSWITNDPNHFDTSAEKRAQVVRFEGHDYNQVSAITDFETFFTQEEEDYFIYYYNVTCYFCQLIKDEMISYTLMKNMPIYFINASTVSGTHPVGSGTLGKSTPSLFTIHDGEIIQIVEGTNDVLNTLIIIESRTIYQNSQ